MADVAGVVDTATATPQAGAQESMFDSMNSILSLMANIAQLATFVGIVPAGASILSMLFSLASNGPPEDNPELDLLNEISEKLNALIRFEHGVEIEVKMLEITNLVTQAQTRLDTLLKEGPQGTDVSESETVQDCNNAVAELVQGVYWYRPYFEEAAYTDAWNFTLYPPTTESSVQVGTTMVFDPSLALPALLKAIEIDTAALVIFHPGDFMKLFASNFSATADVLQQYHDQIVGGFYNSKIPSPRDYEPTGANGTVLSPFIFHWGGILGVIDLYAGAGIIGTYPGYQQYTTNLDEEAQFLRDQLLIDVRLTLGNLTRWKALYIVRGLGRTWSMIQNLKKIAGRKDIGSTNPLSCWSLREINQALGNIFVDPIVPRFSITMSDTIARLSQVAGVTATGPPLSFRQALSSAAP